MNRNAVTVRYAKAYVDSALEQNISSDALHDLSLLYTVLKSYPKISAYLHDCRISKSEKIKKITTIFKNEFKHLTIKFIELIFNQGREEYLIDICRNSIDMLRKNKGIMDAKLIMAQPLSQDLTDHIKEKFEEKIKTTIELTSKVSPEIIGGFIFTIDGMQYDASVATSIKNIRKQLQ
jgi:F-type H+-transporting ATPase subunit delta